MTSTEIMTHLQNLGVELQASGGRLRYKPVEMVTEELRGEMARHKGEIISLLGARAASSLDELCSQCNSSLTGREFPTRWELECTSDPLHFNIHRRKPGADRLWEDVPTPEELG